jgi:hypothetical protein
MKPVYVSYVPNAKWDAIENTRRHMKMMYVRHPMLLINTGDIMTMKKSDKFSQLMLKWPC